MNMKTTLHAICTHILRYYILQYDIHIRCSTLIDKNSIMIVIVSVFVSVSVCIYCIYRILCMLVSCVSFGDTFSTKIMLSACDISSSP